MKRAVVLAVAIIIALAVSFPAASKVSKAPKKPAPLPKLIDLGSTTCVPCKMMMGVLDEIKKEYKGKLVVQFIDVTKNKAAVEKYKVERIPLQVVIDSSGKEVYRHLGYIPAKDLKKELGKLGIKPAR